MSKNRTTKNKQTFYVKNTGEYKRNFRKNLIEGMGSLLGAWYPYNSVRFHTANTSGDNLRGDMVQIGFDMRKTIRREKHNEKNTRQEACQD